MNLTLRDTPSIIFICSQIFLAGCGGSGSSGDGIPAPDSITSKRIIQYVEVSGADPGVIVVQPGDTIEYGFVDKNTIIGKGIVELQVNSWSYTKSGNTGEVEIHAGGGVTMDRYQFTSPDRGTYRSDAEFYVSGNRLWHEGRFEIYDIDSGSTGDACETNNTGSLTIYVSEPISNPPVTVTVSGLGTRSTSHYFPSGAPECGSSTEGAMTFSNVAAGSYTISASDNGGRFTWPATVKTIPQCRCLSLELQ